MSVHTDVFDLLNERKHKLIIDFENGVRESDYNRLWIFINYSISLINNEFDCGSIEYFSERDELLALKKSFTDFQIRLERMKENNSFKREQVNVGSVKIGVDAFNVSDVQKRQKKKVIDKEAIISKVFTCTGIFVVLLAFVAFFYTTWDSLDYGLRCAITFCFGAIFTGVGTTLEYKSRDKFYSSITAVGLLIMYVVGSFCTVVNWVAGLLIWLVAIASSYFTTRIMKSKLTIIIGVAGAYIAMFIMACIPDLSYVSTVGLSMSELGIVCGVTVISIFANGLIYWSEDKATRTWLLILITSSIFWVTLIASGCTDDSISTDIEGLKYSILIMILCITCIASALTFGVYYLRGKLKNSSLTRSDVVFLCINILLTCISLNVLTDGVDLSTITTIVSIALGLGYIIFSIGLLQMKRISEGQSNWLFTGGLLFLLAVPLFVGATGYIPFIWLLASALLFCLYLRYNRACFNITSMILLALCYCVQGVSYYADNMIYEIYAPAVSGLLLILLTVFMYYTLYYKKIGVLEGDKVSVWNQIVLSFVPLFFAYYAFSPVTRLCNMFYDNINTDFASMTNVPGPFYDMTEVLEQYYFDFEAFIKMFLTGVLGVLTYVLQKWVHSSDKGKVHNIMSLGVQGVLSFVVVIAVLVFAVGNGYLYTKPYNFEPWSALGATSEHNGVFICLSIIAVGGLVTGAVSVVKSLLLNVRGLSSVWSVRVEKMIVSVLTLLLSVHCVPNILSVDCEIVCSTICVVFGAHWVFTGFKDKFKALRLVGLAVEFIFLVKVLFDANSISVNLRPFVFIFVGIACLVTSYVYNRMSKKDKEVSLND